MTTPIRPRRLFVSGGSRLSPNGALLWRALGQLLARETGLVVITGGLQQRSDDPTALTADRTIIDGMLAELHLRGIPTEERIETFLPDTLLDLTKLIRFREGRVRVLQKRNPQSRRFSLVHSADVVVSLEGERGTRSVLDVALALERPILPLPFGGGISREVWQTQRADILAWFQVSETEARGFEQTDLAGLDPGHIRDLAGRVHACLMRGFAQGCFVIMRFHELSDPVFDQAIQPALATYGFQAWRTDRSVCTGDVVAAIRDGINHCYFAIADTTDDRPNVMYELGLAHAAAKPVILLRRANSDGSLPRPPFDFQTLSILKYTQDLHDLRCRLETAIAVLSGRLDRSSSLGPPTSTEPPDRGN